MPSCALLPDFVTLLLVNFRSRDVQSYLPLVLLDGTGTGVDGVVATDFAGSSIALLLNGVQGGAYIDGDIVKLLPGPSGTGVYYIVLEPGYWRNFGQPGASGTVTWVARAAAAAFVNYIGNATVEDVPNMFWDHAVWRGVLGTMGGALRAAGAFWLGRYKVDASAKTRTTFKEDNVTALATGATLDQLGAPSSDPIFETLTAIDSTAPTVLSSVPSDGATGVSVHYWFDATFSKDLDPTTVTPASLFIRPVSGAPVGGTIVQMSTTRYRFYPWYPLNAASAYQGVVLISVKDPWGNALAVQHVVGFTTA